jgi:hypothetical protein
MAMALLERALKNKEKTYFTIYNTPSLLHLLLPSEGPRPQKTSPLIKLYSLSLYKDNK